MKKNEIELFIKVQSQLEGMYNEVSALSKKSKDDALNEFKLNFVNNLLEEANHLLKENYKPFKNFVKFEQDKIPTNSDVVMILSQYLACFENMRIDNIRRDINVWYWNLDDKKIKIRTNQPKRFS
ncbi:MAG: hypothetical protein LBC85_09620 [Fibromonadaceae bacterium]|jgi:hypothetical protein|nr:hypothetical protein [Fibromonadaceae bacterium]